MNRQGAGSPAPSSRGQPQINRTGKVCDKKHEIKQGEEMKLDKDDGIGGSICVCVCVHEWSICV